MTKKKKIIILAGMVALLVVTAVLNIWLLGDKNNDPDYLDTASFFTSYRLEREATRAQEILYLDSIINLPDAAEFAAAKATAAAQKLKIVELMDTELRLEGLLKAKGYDDAVVSIGVNTDSINVIVMCDELTPNDTIIIFNTVAEVMGSSAVELVKIFNI